MAKRSKDLEARRQRIKEKQELQASRRQSKERQAAAAMYVFKKHREVRSFHDAILAVFEPEEGKEVSLPLVYSEIRSLHSQIAGGRWADNTKKHLLGPVKQLLLALEKHGSDILECPQKASYSRGLISLAEKFPNWIRPLETWNPRTKNRNKQFSSLLRHLLAKYEVPLFMDEAWLPGAIHRLHHIDWWLHIASGQNIRTAAGLDLPLTKKAAHHFLQAPDDFTISGAFRWGQIHALGGNERIVRGLSGTFLMENFRNEDFWETVIRFFIANPMLDTRHYGPICDYLRDQKYIVPLGAAGPPQPNLCMKNRTADALLKQVEAWHARLHRETQKRKKNPGSWGHHPAIEDFTFIEKKKDSAVTYTIVQLLSAQALLEEGKRLEHCVGSYSWSCHNGSTSIWSVRHQQPGGTFEPLGTVEINNQTKTVVQFAAKRNRTPDNKAWFLLDQWCAKNQIGVSRWLKRF